MTRWLGLLLMACLLCGCEDLGDFFASGFADDNNGSSSDLTTENLTGGWTLNVNLASNTLADADFDSNDDNNIDQTYQETWTVQAPLPQGFLSTFGAAIATATSIEIDNNTFTFVTSGTDPDPALEYEVRDFDTVRFSQTQVTLPVDATVVIRRDGDTMTINDATGNLGTFQFEKTRADIESYTLIVDATTFVFTITPALPADGRPGTITYNYTIEDDNTIMFTNAADNSDSFSVDANLTNSTDTLTLTFPDGRVGVFRRNN